VIGRGSQSIRSCGRPTGFRYNGLSSVRKTALLDGTFIETEYDGLVRRVAEIDQLVSGANRL
jgi:hypothetical protein